LLLLVLAVVSAFGLGACERQRVEVADGEEDGSSPSNEDAAFPPSFMTQDARPDGDASACGPAPIIGVCSPCPSGYVIVKGESTCVCCE